MTDRVPFGFQRNRRRNLRAWGWRINKTTVYQTEQTSFWGSPMSRPAWLRYRLTVAHEWRGHGESIYPRSAAKSFLEDRESAA